MEVSHVIEAATQGHEKKYQFNFRPLFPYLHTSQVQSDHLRVSTLFVLVPLYLI